MSYSAALTSETHAGLYEHLLQHDRDEDVCFALYRPSRGTSRFSGLVSLPLLPGEGERKVHGNASVTAAYFERALGVALERGLGLAFLHSHGRRSRRWQDMSRDDLETEQLYAPRALAITGLPLLGMTIAGDGFWSARFWERVQRGVYQREDCENVRVVGEQLLASFHPKLRPAPTFRESLSRTISAWGDEAQADVARLHIGIVGLRSVGAVVAETLARTGVQRLTLIDFDTVKTVNLDRLLNATERDAALARSKVGTAARALRRHATAANPQIVEHEWSVVEADGFRAALDCDLLFSCVDRPRPRAALNLAAYAHSSLSWTVGSASGRRTVGFGRRIGRRTSRLQAAGVSNAFVSTTRRTSRLNDRVTSTIRATSRLSGPTIHCAATRTSSASG